MERVEKLEAKSLAVRGKAYLRPVITGFILGAVALVCVLLLSAVLMAAAHLTYEAVPIFTVAAAALGGFTAGLVAARIRKKRGLLTGGCSGLLLAAMLFLCCWFISGGLGGAAWTRAAVIAAAGAVGGVLGVGGEKHR